MATRMISIDFDIHKAIEAERRSFEETENEVLRRLLKLNALPTGLGASAAKSRRPWSSKGVVLPHGTELKMEYNGVQADGRIEDGSWICGDGQFAGPSPAASAVATTRSGTTPSLNGWIYWHAKLPGSSKWQPISELRKGN